MPIAESPTTGVVRIHSPSRLPLARMPGARRARLVLVTLILLCGLCELLRALSCHFLKYQRSLLPNPCCILRV